jgi:hypothetical protein
MSPTLTRRQQELRKALRALAPGIPLADAEPVLERAAKLAKTGLPASIAIWQTLTSHIRHRHTDYDRLLDEGYDRASARHFVVEAMDAQLRDWGCTRTIDTEGEQGE